MLELIAHNLAPIMFITVMGMLLIGYPVALTLAAGGLFFFVVGVGLSEIAPDQINLFWPLLGAQPERVFGIMSNDTLLAIPFFTFMGLILERSGMAEDLLDTIGQLFGPVRGGLAYAVILVGALLAATTGVVAASVIAMGLISLPIMQRFNYAPSVATGTIVASGTLAQIVPPSLVLIVMADQLGVSVGDMYIGALWPSLILVGAYCLYIFLLSIFRPALVPALPASERKLGGGVMSLIVSIAAAVAIYMLGTHLLFTHLSEANQFVAAAALAVGAIFVFALVNRAMKLGIISHLAEQVIIVLIPPLALIFLVLGTIFLGIATPTEGGAMGAVGALLLALMKKRLSFSILKSSVQATTTLSAFVMFILIGARVFGLTFYGVNGNVWLEELLLGLPGGEYGFLLVVTVVVFILGCFLDFFEIAFILVPLLAPVATALGIDLVWFGVILGINLQASFLTPPFGFSLFYLRSVAPAKEWNDDRSGRKMPAIRTTDIYKGAIPFIFINVAMILAVISFPYLVTHYKKQPVTPPPAQIQVAPPQGGGLALPPMGGGGSSGGNDGGLGLPPLGQAPLGQAPGGAPAGGGNSLGLAPLQGFGTPGPAGPAAAPADSGNLLGLPPLQGLDAPAAAPSVPAAPQPPRDAGNVLGLPPLQGLGAE
ncbi:TRAP transporter large permease subunit [Poseidonocella sp. HB161398]|uniref:TRAP transporter large permease n=1 Tax=Poseidonocella sp. HB161398 TaxID=2320855 RepID=UPI00110951BA|nr:TRAP transporter large permease subunit [Poseidonocella sp. HB161398]